MSTQYATLLFVVKNNRVLLIRKKRGLGAGKITGPGGRVQLFELQLDAAIREVKEEVGITPLHTVHSGELVFKYTNGLSMRVFLFRSTDYEGDLVETEEASPCWFQEDSIPYSQMWPDARLWLPRVLDNRLVYGLFGYDDERLLFGCWGPNPAWPLQAEPLLA